MKAILTLDVNSDLNTLDLGLLVVAGLSAQRPNQIFSFSLIQACHFPFLQKCVSSRFSNSLTFRYLEKNTIFSHLCLLLLPSLFILLLLSFSLSFLPAPSLVLSKAQLVNPTLLLPLIGYFLGRSQWGFLRTAETGSVLLMDGCDVGSLALTEHLPTFVKVQLAFPHPSPSSSGPLPLSTSSSWTSPVGSVPYSWSVSHTAFPLVCEATTSYRAWSPHSLGPRLLSSVYLSNLGGIPSAQETDNQPAYSHSLHLLPRKTHLKTSKPALT